MPTIPNNVTLTNSSVDVLNAIRNAASTNYQNYVPVATKDAEVIRKIGAVIMDYPALQNEFINALVNRIARVIVSSKLYQNPWAFFKGGILEYGETVEEIFVRMAEPFEFDPDRAEREVFKRQIPSVLSSFYVMNYQKFYKCTISEQMLRQAFLSAQGVTDLIARIVDQLYTAANYDEFLTMKYMLACRILDGLIKVETIPAITKDTIDGVVTTVKGVSNELTFMSKDYNLAGVENYTNKDDQYIILNSRFEAQMSVEVLATAFNMDKVQFSGHMVLVDSFGKLDVPRLDKLFAEDSTYRHFTKAELEALDTIPCILVSRDWFRIFDNLYEFTENYNGQGLYWNYFNHTWKTFGISPYENAALFVAGDPKVTAISISPEAATIKAGGSVQLTPTVTVEDFAPQTVIWTSSSDDFTVSASGLVQASPTASGSATITATSTFDSTVTATAEITIG